MSRGPEYFRPAFEKYGAIKSVQNRTIDIRQADGSLRQFASGDVVVTLKNFSQLIDDDGLPIEYVTLPDDVRCYVGFTVGTMSNHTARRQFAERLAGSDEAEPPRRRQPMR